MSFGGGIFGNDYNKIIPGVYANFENVDLIENAPITGSVAFVIPFITKQEITTYTWTKTQDEPEQWEYVKGTTITTNFDLPEVTTITGTNYSQKAVLFANETFYPVSDMLKQWKEILVNAIQIYTIPISYNVKANIYSGGADDGKKEFTEVLCMVTNSTADQEILRKKLTKYEYNTLLLNDYFENGYNCSSTTTYEVFPFFTIFKEFIDKTNKRFQVVFRTKNAPFMNTIMNTENFYLKWFVTPFHMDSAYYISGMLSSLDPGQSSAGHLYKGYWENSTTWIPESITEQEISLNNGLISFYSIGSSNLRILKDITSAHQENLNNMYNDRMGQIVRLEKYMYDWFSYLYVTNIQGYPNNPSYRRVIKGLIYDQLKQLESNDVVQNVLSDHVSVSAIEGKPDAILIEVQYMPVSGIDYVYIKFWVD